MVAHGSVAPRPLRRSPLHLELLQWATSRKRQVEVSTKVCGVHVWAGLEGWARLSFHSVLLQKACSAPPSPVLKEGVGGEDVEEGQCKVGPQLHKRGEWPGRAGIGVIYNGMVGRQAGTAWGACGVLNSK